MGAHTHYLSFAFFFSFQSNWFGVWYWCRIVEISSTIVSMMSLQAVRNPIEIVTRGCIMIDHSVLLYSTFHSTPVVLTAQPRLTKRRVFRTRKCKI